MLYGMGTVFTFLTLLVFCTKLMSAVLSKFDDDEVAMSTSPEHQPLQKQLLVKVIKEAILQHKNK